MRIRRLSLAIVAGAVAFFGTGVFELSAQGKMVVAGPEGSVGSRPTAVAGESWLNHLHRSFDETSMGKTGQLGPSSAIPAAEFVRWQMGLAVEPASATVTLHGADLYRMNCRGCHGEDGMGAAPEINSLINPVRATSAAAMIERMEAVGMDMNRADAEKLARQSKGMLVDRLQHGGQDMPAFPYLRGAEVDSLVAYLRQLASVRGAEKEQIAIREPRARVGQYIVKSTCHVCHSAFGPNPSPEELYEGAIPPLSTLALRTSRAEFIRKVTHGAPILMGVPPELHRGRMPVFYYLSDEEAADVYLYLTRYPPYPWATLDSKMATTQPDQNVIDSSQQVSGASFTVNAGSPGVHSATTNGNAGFAVLPVFAGFVAITLMGIGFAFTTFELTRLSKKNEKRKRNSTRTDDYREHTTERADRELVA